MQYSIFCVYIHKIIHFYQKHCTLRLQELHERIKVKPILSFHADFHNSNSYWFKLWISLCLINIKLAEYFCGCNVAAIIKYI